MNRRSNASLAHTNANLVNSQTFCASLETQSVFDPRIRFARIKSKLLSRINTSETCVTGSIFRIVRYEARNGDLLIAFKSRIKPDRGSVQLAAELGIGLHSLPTASVRVKTTIFRPPDVLLTGVVAWNKLLSEITMFPKVRRWFLSCLIRGTLLLHHTSPFDAFIPQSIPRLGSPHNILRQPMPLAYFEEIGGRITTIGDLVLFRSHCQDSPRYIITVSDDGILSIGTRFEGMLFVELPEEQLCTSQSLKIGSSHSVDRFT